MSRSAPSPELSPASAAGSTAAVLPEKGGIGAHVTKVVKRTVTPNLRVKRVWVPELGQPRPR
ncbi:MAG: hypothetical protein R3F11_27000 [Verrucomicrobiales bacterium]